MDGCVEEEEKRPSNMMNPILGEIPKTNPPKSNLKREMICLFFQIKLFLTIFFLIFREH